MPQEGRESAETSRSTSGLLPLFQTTAMPLVPRSRPDGFISESKVAVLHNPEAGSDEWFHGTSYHPDYAFDLPEVNHDNEQEYGVGHHWNTALGTHWTSLHDVATRIAHDSDSGGDDAEPHVFHARLHLNNPRHYDSEFDMDREVYGHEYDTGNHPSRHDQFHLEEWEGHPYLGHERDLRTRGSGNPGRFTQWISNHPDRYEIGQRFKQRLIDAGHDGITYGNEFETAHGVGHRGGPTHISAIAFHPDQTEITGVHQVGHPCPGRPSSFTTGRTAAVHTATDATFAKSSMMIALVPPRSLADKLVVDDGEEATEMHVTLAYLPHVEPHDTGRITGVVAEWASRHRAPVCRIQGAGTFVKPGAHVLWAAVDVLDSSRLHSTLIDALERAGFKPSKEHGFTAHLTMAYRKHHVRFLPKIEPESFTAYNAWVCRGDDWRPVPFGGGTAKQD